MMMKSKYIGLLGLLCFSLSGLVAQDDAKLQFNGLGRANLLQTGIEGEVLEGDTTTPRSNTDGEFLLDLKMNAQPNTKTEVQAILRLRNEFGGFFGSGVTVEVRELWARGVIANRIKYRVGDMDVVMSPYTFFSPDEEGTVNEPAIFQPQKELIYYEQFYDGNNSRRMQGASLDFGLQFPVFMRSIDTKGFLARVRGTDFFTVPSRFVTGGELQFETYQLDDSLGTQFDFGVNIIYTFDDLNSGEANTGIRNAVTTTNFDLLVLNNSKMAVNLFGEGGFSAFASLNDSTTFYRTDDSFIDVTASINLKPKKLTFSAGFIDIGPDFFSIGAQSKKIDFNAEKRFYDRTGNAEIQRQPTLFDISRDPSLYTFQLSENLMPYDPRFSNTFPYGKATPNRRGVNLGADYGTDDDNVEARIDASLVSEIAGQGSTELKDFTLLKASAGLNIHQLIDWKKELKLTFGYQFEQTSRDGEAVEQVDLTSNLLEIGFQAELFRDFMFLLGAKQLRSEGSDYIPRIDSFDIIADFPRRTIIDDTETLLATGFRYNFKEGIYITLQYHTFATEFKTETKTDYRLDQVFLLYTMNF